MLLLLLFIFLFLQLIGHLLLSTCDNHTLAQWSETDTRIPFSKWHHQITFFSSFIICCFVRVSCYFSVINYMEIEFLLKESVNWRKKNESKREKKNKPASWSHCWAIYAKELSGLVTAIYGCTLVYCIIGADFDIKIVIFDGNQWNLFRMNWLCQK